MKTENSYFPGAEFKKCMAARDYTGAHKALARAASAQTIDEASFARWRAHVYQFEGRIADAVELLSPLIEKDDIPGKFLRHQRARIYAHAGMHDEALSDFRALAEDPTPRIADSLRAGCRFEIAYILAVRGSPEFEAAYDLIHDERQQFVADSMLCKSDLFDLYSASRN
ncbi:MAG TPA: hypothetical protein PKA55_11405 [Rhodoblastus sp.]|nr:hypothetical protein [Rhodoblastus sp.]